MRIVKTRMLLQQPKPGQTIVALRFHGTGEELRIELSDADVRDWVAALTSASANSRSETFRSGDVVTK